MNAAAKFACLAISVGGACLAGCATADSAGAMAGLQAEVTGRGVARVAWPQDAAASVEVERVVGGLLAAGLTPERAAQIAVLNNRHLRATLEDLGVSQADVIAAGRLPNPTLGASVRWPDRVPRGPDVEFSLGVDLLSAVLLPLRTKVAREQLAQTRHRVAAEVLTLAADAKAAVFTVQAAQQVRERLAVIVETNAAAAELARRQFDAGNISQLDLVQQQVAWQQSKLEFAQTELVLRADCERLTRLLGLFTAPAGGAISGALPTLPSAEPTLGDVENLAVAQRLDLAAAASQVTLAQAALKLKRDTRLLPATVSLGVDTERNADGTHVTGPGLQLALPIFDQGQADLMRLEAGLRRAEAEVAARTADICSEAREARDQLLAARAAVELHEQSLLPQRQLILREMLLHYNAGDKNSYEMLAAKEREQQAERAAIAALRDYWLARVALERALGGRLPDLVTAAPARP